MSFRRILTLLAAGAALGFGIFGVLVYRAVTISHTDQAEAVRRVGAIRAALPPGPPVLALDELGNVVRRDAPRTATPSPVSRLHVVVYYADAQRLVSADVPFWFFRIKGPAAQYALRDTGFDLDRLGITPSDLERYGPTVVVDRTRPGGDLLLAWTQ